MNKAYRVIFNHATQTWTAVAEFAKAKGKTKSLKLSAVAVAIAAAGTAHAATAVNLGGGLTSYSEPSLKRLVISTGREPLGHADANRAESLYIGDGTGVARPGSIRIGMNIKTDTATGNNRDLLIGNNASTGGGGVDALGTAIGHSTYVAGPSVGVGYMAQADIFSAAGAQGAEHGGVAIGAFSYIGGNINGGTAVGSLSSAAAQGAVSIGVGSGAQIKFIDGKGGEVNFGEANGASAISIGDYTAARSKGAVAIGNNATTGIQRSGIYADVAAHDAVAVGNGSAALSSYSIAIGSNAQASVYDTADITRIEADIAKQDTLIAGFDTELADWKAKGLIGTSGGINDVPMPNITPAQHDQINAVIANKERANIVKTRLQRDLTLVKNAIATNKKRENAIAIGNQTKALALNTIAIGNSTVVTGISSIGIGDRNTVTGNYSGAIGDPNFVTSNQSYAIGNNNTVNSENTFVLGNSIGQNARNTNLTGTTIANSVYLGSNSEAAAGSVPDDRTGSAGVSQLTSERGGGNTQTAGTGAYRGTTLVTDFVDSFVGDTSFDLAATKTGFQYATTGGDPALAQEAEYAGAVASGVVTVGASGAGSAAGNERRIVNVAAGLVTSRSTDAVNGSQLYAAMVQASRPISFTGNSNKDTGNNGTEQLLGSNLRIIGATTAAADARDESKETRDSYVAKNVATVVSNGEVQIQFAENPEFKAVDLEDEVVPNSSTLSSATAPTENLNKAVSLGDVLNTGWNLEVEGAAADLVRPYDTVNFIGEGVTITEENDSTAQKTNIKIKVDQPETATMVANPGDAGTIGAGDKPNALTTAQNVADMINAAAWKATSAATPAGTNEGTSVELVNAGDTVTFEADSGVKIVQDAGKFTFSVKTDGKTTKINDAGEIEALQPETATVTNVAAGEDKAGSVVAPTAEEGAKLVNAQTLADAINNSGFTLKHSVTDGEDLGGDAELINPGEVIDMVAGKNLSVKQEADGRIIYATKENVSFTEIKVAAPNAADNPITIANNAITGLNSTLPAFNTDPTKTDAPVLNETQLGSAATLNDVLNAGWNLQNDGKAVDFVKPYETVNFVSGTGIKITNETDGTTSNITVSLADGASLDLTKADVTTDGESGVIKLKEGDDVTGVTSAQTVINAINNAGWQVTSDVTGSGDREGAEATNELVKAGEQVKFIAGDNLKIEQAGQNFTYSLNPDININSAKVGNPDAPITIGTTPEGDNVITGLTNTLAPLNTNPAETKAPTFDDVKLGSAATLSDVLNAGWNLQNNGTAKDFVKAYDTVNFVDGKGTKAVVDVKADGTIADVKYDVDVTQLSAPITNNEDGSLAGPTESPALADALKAAEDALAALPETATPEEKAAAEKAVQDAQDAITNAGNQLATAQNVADSVNNSFWNINTSQDGANEAKVGDGKVNPSNNVVFNGVGAVQVAAGTTDEGKYTVDFSVATDDTTVEVKDGKIAAKTSTLAAAPTDDPAAPTAGTILPGDAPNALTTAQNVADMINAAAWKATSAAKGGVNEGSSVELVNAGDTVTFEADSGIKIVQDAGKFTFSVVAAGSAVDTNEAAATEDAPADAANNTGKIAPKGDATALMNAQNVADAINASGFKLKTSATDGEDLGGDDELINPGDAVEMIAGKNLSVKQEADGKVTYATKENVSFTEIKVATPDNLATSPITIANNAITGLNSTLPQTVNGAAPTTSQAAPTLAPADLTKAATVGDVLNAGWNLKANNADVDFVKPYDTVNFVDGKGTKVVTSTDSETSNVQIDVDVTQLSAPITNNEDGSVTGPANSTELADALTAAEEALAALPETATPEEKAAAEKAVQDAKDAITNAGNALATAQNVADAINASGWNATSGKVGTGEVEGTTNELINPSEIVTFQAGDNMMLKQEGNVFTYSVNPNPVFNNVTANQVTVGGNPEEGKAPIVIGTNPEGVNEITGLDTTLPVPAAEQAKPADINESKAATLGDVLNAGWNLKNNGEAKDVVTPYDTVDFVDGNGTKVVVESKDGVSTVKVDIDPTQIAAPVTNVVEGDQAGSVTGPTTAAEEALKAAQDELAALPADASEEAKQAAADKVAAAQNAVNNAGNQLATAQNVANAINNSGWKATSGTVGTGTRDGADATVELINPAETVTFNAGDNLVIEQAGNEFTYSLNKDIAINSAKIGNADAPITIGTTPEGDNVIDGLSTTIAAPTTEVSPADKPAADKLDNAATLGDVLNAGWNLKNNGEARDVVTPYDTVNFVNGNGTTVSVVTTNGTTSDIKVDVKVDGTTVKFDENGNLTAVQPDTLVNGDKVGGNINLVDSDTVSVAQGDNPGDIKFNVNTGGSEVTADGKAAPKAGDENKVATVGDIVNTINGVGFNAKVAQTGTGVGIDKGGDALVNAGDTVTITAGDNIQVTKDGLNYTVETKKDVKFDTVQVGGNEAEGKAPISIGTSPEGKNVVANLDTTIAAPTTANNPADKPTGDALNNAATLGDVLNAGWNLQENGTAKDVVTPYDTVNFKDGNGTKVNITSNGTVSEVKVDVKTANTDTVNLGTDAAGNLVANVNTSPITNAANGSVNAPANPAALATAGDVANAINGSGFTLTAQGANGSIVNPGETVDMKNTDGNIAITKDAANNDVVYNLSPTINVTNVNAAGTVTAGNLTVAPNGNVDMGGNRIQNVAPGVAPTDAVNVSQLGTAIGNAIAPIQNRIDDLDDNYRAGLAGSAALVNIPQVTRPGANLVGVGVGHFKGQSAIAVGFSSASDNERLIFKISGSANTQGDYSIGSGMGWQW